MRRTTVTQIPGDPIPAGEIQAEALMQRIQQLEQELDAWKRGHAALRQMLEEIRADREAEQEPAITQGP